MLAKINVADIIGDHFDTLRDYDTKGRNIGDITLFYVIPFIVAVVLAVLKIDLHKDLVNLLVTALSVFAALLFNLLLLVYDVIKKTGDATNLEKLKREYLKEIYTNISYSIFVSILSIIFLLTSLLNFGAIKSFCCTSEVRTTLMIAAFFLLVNFLLTLFMILKRIHVLLSKEMS
jgi:di/tricarboxylate transporter